MTGSNHGKERFVTSDTVLRATKKRMMAGRAASIEATFEAEHEAMAKQAGSPEHIEAVMAFVEKRKPDFRNLKK